MNKVLERWTTRCAKRYGHKTGWLRHHFHLVRYRCGGFSQLGKVDWTRVTRLVFVCKGNICRSPYAEEKARALGLHATSFGLETSGARPAERAAIRIAGRLGIDLTGHRSRSVVEFSIETGDLLLGMEPGHVEAVLRLVKEPKAQVTLLGLWCRSPRPHIEDPYGLGDDYCETCFGFVDSALENISKCLKSARTAAVKNEQLA